jgi:hypothetical protein
MFNLFKGGIKGRLFLTIRQRGGNNPAKGGKGGWEMKKGIVFVAFLLGVLVLVGWGCGQNSAAPADTNLDTNVSETSSDNTPEVPAGWTEYRNERWGVNFVYPTDWQYQEYSETVEGEEIVTLAFSDQELPETLPPEPLFPIMVFRDTRTVTEIVTVYDDAVSIEDMTLGGKVVKVVTLYSDILEQNYRIYIVPIQSGVIKFMPLDNSFVSTVETMIVNLTEVE